MRALMYLLTVLAVMGLAFWAYRENYRTQAQIDEMRAVQDEIARLREDLGVLRAEWAYLNRPERLRDLVDMNFDRLRLGPVQANQFGGARNVDYPDPNAADPDAAPARPAGALHRRRVQRPIVQSPAAEEMQVCTMTPSPSVPLVTSPVRMSRTAPERSGSTQP